MVAFVKNPHMILRERQAGRGSRGRINGTIISMTFDKPAERPSEQQKKKDN